ncbi:hypothetical protein [Hyalangium minutum]|uniref:Uncharacterized protein n=1 Tax=Hyalangium minutum TaxID=394096 RepID=A0A085WSA5_9BACT|nr:hypothetical protein [Hyalangium minutum]KFE70568.1 hypothetical protein DB31_5610 [Hyalangium minutum]
MMREQAVAIAESAREEKEVPPDARVESAELQYIELGEGEPEQPSPVRDVMVWLVRFGMPRGRWVELAVDDRRGKVVRVRRSR